MPTNILVVYYSSYGHVFQMARAVADGARSVKGADVRVRRVAELADAKQKLSAQEGYRKA